MPTKAPAIVRAGDGRFGTILDREIEAPLESEAFLDVLLDDGQRLLVPAKFLIRQGDGTFDLTLSTVEMAGFAEERSEVVVPVVAETVEVKKRRVETGRVRLHKTVKSTEHVVDEPLIFEEVEIEHVPINRPIAEAVGPRQEGDTLIVPLLEEVLVVEKRLILREEVRITRRRVERRSPEKVTLRSEEATIERSAAEEPAT